MKKWVVLFAEKIEKLKTLKYHIAIKKVFSINCSACGSRDEKIFKEKYSIEVVKFLV